MVSFPNRGTNRDGSRRGEAPARADLRPIVIFAISNKRTSVYTRVNTSPRSRKCYETVVIYPRTRGVAASRRDRTRREFHLAKRRWREA